ncbi:MAG TPA: hypothetical protein PKY70_14645 [Nakamurella multipartita]|nr:hypothetical protein [Nakamurella multipartita]
MSAAATVLLMIAFAWCPAVLTQLALLLVGLSVIGASVLGFRLRRAGSPG